ncbi:MAG: oligosaccharide flippase family protein [Candidatus Pacearchaeota archaeon]|jgi:O-antigen/teichoic acid export membrane protein
MFKLKSFKDSEEEILKSGVIFLIGSIGVAIFNYLYHLSMGRMLGPADYGILGSLFAIIYIVTYSTSAFNLTISKFSAEYKGKEKSDSLKALIKKSLQSVAVIGLVILVIYLISTPFIARFMNLSSITGLIIVGLVAYLSIISAVLTGALNGLHKFVWQNSAGFASTFIKFILAITLVYIGLSVNGALLALLIGILAGLFISAYPIKHLLKGKTKEKLDSKKISIFLFFVFFASISSVSIITFDQILVKHYFSSADAGLYAAAGMIAKIIWFGSGFLTGALFPKVVSLTAKGKNTSKLLKKSLLYTFSLAAIGCIVYFMFPEIIVSLLYGSDYSSIISFVPIFAVGMAFYSLTQILISYNLAKENYSFIWAIIIGFVFEMLGIAFFHNSLTQVVYVFLSVNLAIVLALLFYSRKDIFNGGLVK